MRVAPAPQEGVSADDESRDTSGLKFAEIEATTRSKEWQLGARAADVLAP